MNEVERRRERRFSLLGRSGKVGRQFADRAAEKALDVAEHVDFVRSDDVEHHAVLVVAGRAGETFENRIQKRQLRDVAGFQAPRREKPERTDRCT